MLFHLGFVVFPHSEILFVVSDSCGHFGQFIFLCVFGLGLLDIGKLMSLTAQSSFVSCPIQGVIVLVRQYVKGVRAVVVV